MHDDAKEFALGYLEKLAGLMRRTSADSLAVAMKMVGQCWRDGKHVFIVGNGGSASTASHWACDLGKGAVFPGVDRLRVLSLTDNVAHLSAIANDIGYDAIFEEQLRNLLQGGDLLIGISASGNSANVVRAFEYAGSQGARTLAFVGFDGGRLVRLADHAVHFDSHEYGPVEDMQLIANHLITDWLRKVVLPGAAACARGSQT